MNRKQLKIFEIMLSILGVVTAVVFFVAVIIVEE